MADSKNHTYYTYSSVFTSEFVSGHGQNLRLLSGANVASGIGKTMSGVLPKDALTNLKDSMAALQRELTKERMINRSNIFETNANIADAYKKAFGCARTTADRLQENWDKALAKLEQTKPAILKAKNPEEMERIRGSANISKKDRNLLKKYDSALQKFNNAKGKADAKYGKPMAALGQQLQAMASNRGFIVNTTQNMFDLMRNGTQTEFRGSFNRLMEEHGKIPLLMKTGTEAVESGNINEVYRTQIDLQDLYVKPGKLFVSTETNAKDFVDANSFQLMDVGIVLESDLESNVPRDRTVVRVNDAAFRDQGEQIVSKLLGLDSIVKSQLAIDNNGGYVSAMNAAPGRLGAHHFVVKSQAEADAARAKVADILEVSEKYGIDLKEQTMGADLRHPDLLIDLTDPSIQVEALKLGVVDYISGQLDRHSANFFINKDSSGYKMIGIDNDGAFSSNPHNRQEMTTEEALPMVTPELKDKILALNPKEVVNALKGVVDRGEYGDLALQRLEKRVVALQNRAKTCEVVAESDFNADTLEKFDGFCGPLGTYGLQARSPQKALAALDKYAAASAAEKEREHKNAERQTPKRAEPERKAAENITSAKKTPEPKNLSPKAAAGPQR